jgi:DNA-directed RNA polymerase subunit RPC12/RpoP
MKCLICGKPAAEIDSDGDCEERSCAECGHYRITKTALVLMKARDLRFDVERTRKWLAQQQGSGVIPKIDHTLAARLIDV